MQILYNILTYIVDFHLRLIAQFNHKIALGVKGRGLTFNKLNSQIGSTDKTIWFHCASLGEYEQGLPVFEAIKNDHPDHKIILSFFSPSGYEVRKNCDLADLVVYLPLDTKANARRFLDLVHPELVIFVKYEIWPNYLSEINKRDIKAVLISALFRPDQSFFKPIGKWMRQSLRAFDWIFVQDEQSETLLREHGIDRVSISGDTRFDRVGNQLKVNNAISFMDDFLNDSLCVVAGSTWPEGEKLLIEYINNDKTPTKYVIAPHNIKSHEIQKLKASILPSVIQYSECEDSELKEFKVLILDTIGLLSKVYSYASIAYVGGAIGTTGLHNTLEPAVFGVPILIGSNYQKFPEAKNMIKNDGMFAVANQQELNDRLNQLINNADFRLSSGNNNKRFIKKNQGAVVQIMDYLRK
ncbi:MAG: 3-deoxy-D-manno-octulosonic acid transferase [Flavobacteriaceae bacterium]|nr:3-deoxy-D-manno-octulosonic acid transferase [Flavobacteriaceae bacterium]